MANNVHLDIVNRAGDWTSAYRRRAEDYVFINMDGATLSINCKRCGDSEEGTFIEFVEAGTELEEILFAIRAHECGKQT
jgi:hypothetical protein